MKKLLMAAPFGLALALAGGAASAATGSGTIYFTGEIKSGTCSVDVTTPGSPPGSAIYLGQAIPADFTAVGTELRTKPFTLRVDPSTGCTITPGVATVNFTSNDGPNPIDNRLHGLRAGTAEGVGIVIRDTRDQSIIAHGADSKDFTTVADTPLVMNFSAGYMSAVAANAIRPGDAFADINFTVTLP